MDIHGPDKVQHHGDKVADNFYAYTLLPVTGALVGGVCAYGVQRAFDITSPAVAELIAGAGLIGGSALGAVLCYKKKVAEKLTKLRQ